MQVSIYQNSSDNTGKLIDLSKVLRLIKKGAYQKQIEQLREILRVHGKDDYNLAKKSLPSVTFSGTFAPTRLDANIQTYSNIICLDVDGITEAVMEDLRDAFTLDKNIFSYWTSPSGSGMKILVRVDSGPSDHYSAFECLRLYFLNNYDVVLDPSGKNVARLCYLGADESLYYNGEAIPFHIEVSESVRERTYGDRTLYSKEHKVTVNDLKVYEVCKKWSEFHVAYVQGSRNSNIFICACSLNRTGMNLENAILSIARDRVDLPVQEIKEVVRKVYENKKSEFNTITIFDFEKNEDALRGAMEMQSPADIMDQISSSPSEGLVKSGFEKQDATFGGGKEKGAVYIYVGREKTYKSVHAISEACKLVMEGKCVLYLNGEMSKRQFMQIVAQQQMAIPRTVFNSELQRIKEWAAVHLKKLSVVSGKDFTYDKIIKSADAIRMITGEDVVEIFVDGIGHMIGGIDTPHLIENSKTLKEIAKDCNEGRGTAMTALIHTDKDCNYWNRKPQTFIRGKTMVLSNFDGSVGFSRFLVEGSQNDDWTDFKLRNDLYHIKVEDYRLTGETSDIVLHLNANCLPSESGDDPMLYEFKQETKKKY